MCINTVCGAINYDPTVLTKLATGVPVQLAGPSWSQRRCWIHRGSGRSARSS